MELGSSHSSECTFEQRQNSQWLRQHSHHFCSVSLFLPTLQEPHESPYSSCVCQACGSCLGTLALAVPSAWMLFPDVCITKSAPNIIFQRDRLFTLTTLCPFTCSLVSPHGSSRLLRYREVISAFPCLFPFPQKFKTHGRRALWSVLYTDVCKCLQRCPVHTSVRHISALVFI